MLDMEIGEAQRTISVLLVEDHDAVRDGLALLLGRAGFTMAGSTAYVERGLALAGARRPDVIVLDLHLGMQDGREWLGRLRTVAPEARILVYTAVEEPGVLELVLNEDIDGLALKACSARELVEAVTAVAAGRRYLDPRLTAILSDSVGADLSRREREVLALLAEGHTGEQVANKLVLSPETIRTHVRNSMRKLDAPTRTRAIVLALQDGRIGVAPRERAG